MMSSKDIWREIGIRFNPFEPAVKPEWRVERQDGHAREISSQLGSNRGAPYHILLMGPTGAGKSTELLSAAEERANAEDCVVFVDVYQHFALVVNDTAAFDKIGSWEVVFLIGLALIKKARDEGIPEADLHEAAKALALSWEKLAQASDTPVIALEVGAIFEAAQLLVPAFMTAAGAAPVAVLAATAGSGFIAKATRGIKSWFLPMGRSVKTIPDQDTEAQKLLYVVNELIEFVRSRSNAQRLIVFVDGLDRIQKMDHARALMIDSGLLTYLRCALVITAPYALYQRQSTVLNSRYQYCKTLYSEAVLDKKEPWRDGSGIEMLLELYKKRTRDLEAPDLIDDAWLRYLAYYSAGHTRNFVRLISSLADYALIADASSATEALIAKTLRNQRLLLEARLDRSDIAILQSVIDDPKRTLPDDDKTEALLQDNRLLPYLNDSEWYFPHTLLTMHRLSMPTQRPKPQLP
jgi:hypothetical protein